MGNQINVAVDVTAPPSISNPLLPADPTEKDSDKLSFGCRCSQDDAAIHSLLKIWEIGSDSECCPVTNEKWFRPLNLSEGGCYIVLVIYGTCRRDLHPGAQKDSSLDTLADPLLRNLVSQAQLKITRESLLSPAFVGVSPPVSHAALHCRLTFEIHLWNGIAASTRTLAVAAASAAELHAVMSNNSFAFEGPNNFAISVCRDTLSYVHVSQRRQGSRQLSASIPDADAKPSRDCANPTSESVQLLHDDAARPDDLPALVRHFFSRLPSVSSMNNSRVSGSVACSASAAATEALNLSDRRWMSHAGQSSYSSVMISPRTLAHVIAQASPVVAGLAISPRGVRSLVARDPLRSDLSNCKIIPPLRPRSFQANPLVPTPLAPQLQTIPRLPVSLLRDHMGEGLSSPAKRARCEQSIPANHEVLKPSNTQPSSTPPAQCNSGSPSSQSNSTIPILKTSNGPTRSPPTAKVAPPATSKIVDFRIPGLKLNALRQNPPYNESSQPSSANVDDTSSDRSFTNRSPVSFRSESSNLYSQNNKGFVSSETRSKSPLSFRPGRSSDSSVVNGVSMAELNSQRSGSPEPRLSLSAGRLMPHQLQYSPGSSVCSTEESSDAIIENYCKNESLFEAEEPVDEEPLSREVMLSQFRHVCSEVIPTARLYISGVTVAQDLQLLKETGITHIINVAGDTCRNAFPSYIRYLTFVLQDNRNASEEIQSILYNALEFVSRVLSNPKHRVLIHCREGVSRSASLIVAYLMWKGRLSFSDALVVLRKSRQTCNPNTGFTFILLRFQRELLQSQSSPRPTPPTPPPPQVSPAPQTSPSPPQFSPSHNRAISSSPVEKKLLRLSLHHDQAPFIVALGIALCEPNGKSWAPKLSGLDPRFFYILRAGNEIFFWRGSETVHRPISESFVQSEYLRALSLFETCPSSGWKLHAINDGEEPDGFWSCLFPADSKRHVERQKSLDKSFEFSSSHEIFNFAEYLRRHARNELVYFNASVVQADLIRSGSPIGSPCGTFASSMSQMTESSRADSSRGTGSQPLSSSRSATFKRRFTVSSQQTTNTQLSGVPCGQIMNLPSLKERRNSSMLRGDLQSLAGSFSGSLCPALTEELSAREHFVIISPRRKTQRNEGEENTEIYIEPHAGGIPLVSFKAIPHLSLEHIQSSLTSVDGCSTPSQQTSNRSSIRDDLPNIKSSLNLGRDPMPSGLELRAAFKSARSHWQVSPDERPVAQTDRAERVNTDRMMETSASLLKPFGMQSPGRGHAVVRAGIGSVQVREGSVDLEPDIPYLYVWPHMSCPLDVFDDEDLLTSGFYIVAQFGPKPLLEMLGRCVGSQERVCKDGTLNSQRKVNCSKLPVLFKEREPPCIPRQIEQFEGSPDPFVSPSQISLSADNCGDAMQRSIDIPPNSPTVVRDSSLASESDNSWPPSIQEVEIETVVTPTVLWIWRGDEWKEQPESDEDAILDDFKRTHGISDDDSDVFIHWENERHESDAFQKLLWLN